MKIHSLFEFDITRDIPPVVYFHEQSPEKVEAEVREYIITGGWKSDHPNHVRVKTGIHEHYVKLLRRIVELVDTPGGPDLPASWISGFYGSGKSSFAKLLGLALDGAKLPDGTPLAHAWLARDKSQKAAELRKVWEDLNDRVKPIAVVFDIGGVSRGDEHIHTAVVRQVQSHLDYCNISPLVANYELKLERDGHYERFLTVVEQKLGKPWAELRSTHMVEDNFSAVLHELFPELYQDKTDWMAARDGQQLDTFSAEEAARAIGDMLERRATGKTLFIVIDEVSQYIHQDDKRMLALQSLVSALGQRLKGKAWLFATGQQKLDDQNDANVLNKMKDRFPESLRVHLDATSIRDVVHRRLLQKNERALPVLRELYATHRSNLSLFAYGCETLTEEDFVEVYPLLPQHINLILRITSALRTRSTRAQGDHHAIRGLLQMLGELFRTQRNSLTEAEVGALITLDQIYDIQGSALESDIQNAMARIFDFCASNENAFAVRCAKAVALLELLQADEDGEATTAEFVARCLYAHVTEGDNRKAVGEALETLREANLLSYGDKVGYRIQSSLGQEWDGERQNMSVPPEELGNLVKDALRILLGDAKQKPELGGRAFTWEALFSTENTHHDDKLVGSRDDTTVVIDFRLLPKDAQDFNTWVNRSGESSLSERILWIAGAYLSVMEKARQIGKSRRMVARYEPTRAILSEARQRLLNDEKGRLDRLLNEFKKVVADAFMAGHLYFRGADTDPNDYGTSFHIALARAGQARLPTIYNHFIATNVSDGELNQLLQKDLAGPSTKFFDELGILSTDGGRIIASCTGTVPQRVLELVERDHGLSGHTLLRQFASPPYGYTTAVVKACCAGLLRAGKIRIRLRDGSEVTSVGDPGTDDLFKDRGFKASEIYPAGEQKIKPTDRFKIADTFKAVFGVSIPAENDAIADELAKLLQPKTNDIGQIERRLNQLPNSPETPEVLTKLRRAIEECLRPRPVEPRVLAVIKNLDALRDGVGRLNAYMSELDDEAVAAVREAKGVADIHINQLAEIGELTAPLQDTEKRIAQQLKSERPWAGIDALAPDLDQVREAYRAARLGLINKQTALSEAAREQIKAIPGFEKLDADQRNHVLRPVTEALRDTTPDEVRPRLNTLLEGLQERLDSAHEQAVQFIDEASQKQGEVIVRVDIEVRDRVIATAKDVEVLLDEIRTRLLDQLEHEGRKVRIRLR